MELSAFQDAYQLNAFQIAEYVPMSVGAGLPSRSRRGRGTQAYRDELYRRTTQRVRQLQQERTLEAEKRKAESRNSRKQVLADGIKARIEKGQINDLIVRKQQLELGQQRLVAEAQERERVELARQARIMQDEEDAIIAILYGLAL